MKGWVYVVSTEAMPGLVKVGFSTKDPDLRAKELSAAGLPHPYAVDYDVLVEEPFRFEQAVHRRLSEVHEKKEWFRCSPEDAVAAVREVVGSAAILESFKRVDRLKAEQLRREAEEAAEKELREAERRRAAEAAAVHAARLAEQERLRRAEQFRSEVMAHYYPTEQSAKTSDRQVLGISVALMPILGMLGAAAGAVLGQGNEAVGVGVAYAVILGTPALFFVLLFVRNRRESKSPLRAERDRALRWADAGLSPQVTIACPGCSKSYSFWRGESIRFSCSSCRSVVSVSTATDGAVSATAFAGPPKPPGSTPQPTATTGRPSQGTNQGLEVQRPHLWNTIDNTITGGCLGVAFVFLGVVFLVGVLSPKSRTSTPNTTESGPPVGRPSDGYLSPASYPTPTVEPVPSRTEPTPHGSMPSPVPVVVAQVSTRTPIEMLPPLTAQAIPGTPGPSPLEPSKPPPTPLVQPTPAAIRVELYLNSALRSGIIELGTGGAVTQVPFSFDRKRPRSEGVGGILETATYIPVVSWWFTIAVKDHKGKLIIEKKFYQNPEGLSGLRVRITLPKDGQKAEISLAEWV